MCQVLIALNQCSTNIWVDTWPTLNQHLCQHLIDNLWTDGRVLTDFDVLVNTQWHVWKNYLTFDQLSTEMLFESSSSIDQELIYY